jgi:hypothetical protein
MPILAMVTVADFHVLNSMNTPSSLPMLAPRLLSQCSALP